MPGSSRTAVAVAGPDPVISAVSLVACIPLAILEAHVCAASGPALGPRLYRAARA
jgi:hypothetical protein